MRDPLPGLGARSRQGPLKLSARDLVATRLPEGGALYPLIMEPRVEGLDLVAWSRDNRARLDEEIARYGGVLLRGFRVESVAAFEEFVRVSSAEPLPYGERSSPRDVVKDRIYTSTSHPADQQIFLHNEQSYNLTFPGRIHFHCVTPAAEGGATPVACTRRIFRDMPRALAARFIERRYRYTRNFGEGLGLSWQAAFQTSDRAEVERYCRDNDIELTWLDRDRLRTSQVRRCVARHPRTGELAWFNHATFFHVSTLDPGLVEHLRATYREEEMPNNTFYGDGGLIEPDTLRLMRVLYEGAKVSVPWQRGDCLVLDNMLMAHGREAFRGERLVVVAMSEPRRWEDVAADELPA